MSKFNIGDRVKVIACDADLRKHGVNMRIKTGDIYTINSTVDSGVRINEVFGSNHLLFKHIIEIPNYPNPPHKHAELIKAWADGANIEVKIRSSFNTWNLCPCPAWLVDSEYRIKPAKSDKDIQIEKLEQQAKDLAVEIAKLKEN